MNMLKTTVEEGEEVQNGVAQAKRREVGQVLRKIGLWLHHVEGDEGTGEVHLLEVRVHHLQKNLKLPPVNVEKCSDCNGCEEMRRNSNNGMFTLRTKLRQGPKILKIRSQFLSSPVVPWLLPQHLPCLAMQTALSVPCTSTRHLTPFTALL
jgi:hypothetical protein